MAHVQTMIATGRTVIAGATVIDGSGAPGYLADVEIADGLIGSICAAAGGAPPVDAIDGRGLVLAPGFIDAHTHDDLVVIASPDMAAKITQGVTTVVVGNCGISASTLIVEKGELPDPLVLLGGPEEFQYDDFTAYADAVDAASPATNVVALIGHTTLRIRHMASLAADASDPERSAMRHTLDKALDAGAFGLSTGLAYANAGAASTEEVKALAEALRGRGAVYCSHLRSEGAEIVSALDEAFAIGRHAGAAVIISHLKCVGVDQHGRSAEILARIEAAAVDQPVGCDCYPYNASSSTLDLKQVVPETAIKITWSATEPEQSGRMLADLARDWAVDLTSAARRLQPAGAVYFCMADADVDRIIQHRLTMIGSDGLPCDPRPHPRLWGSFPRVIDHYFRKRGLFTLEGAIHKMTGLPAQRFGLADRGFIREGLAADLVLFDPKRMADRATYDEPARPAVGIFGVWVNGVRTYTPTGQTHARGGRLLRRQASSSI
jgi:N-acyl-D-amino-acid deacylase